MLKSEVEYGLKSRTPQGYNRLIIASHKTGYLQSATLFIYPEIYAALDKFIKDILPKIPTYFKQTHDFVFRTFKGDRLQSSNITPILQLSLSKREINFQGTATDLRKGGVTLSGNMGSNLDDLMSDFLCHSKNVMTSTIKSNWVILVL